jgi:hypothetical protein
VRDEGFLTAFGILNVARSADLDTVEATFARLYKAARRQPDGDLRRQELNGALETLRDADRRAREEISTFHVPLAGTEAVPAIEELARELLPVEFHPVGELEEHVLAPTPQEVAAEAVAALDEVPWPDERDLLRRYAARLALEQLDPWTEA